MRAPHGSGTTPLTRLLRSALAALMAFVAFAAGVSLAALTGEGSGRGEPILLAYGLGFAIAGSAGGTLLGNRLSPARLPMAVSIAAGAAILAAIWVARRVPL